jgi:predicted nucleic acid-binding protein
LRLVIDASVAIKWLLKDDPNEHDVEKAEAILALLTEGAAQAFQPHHWKVEALSVVARKAPEMIETACALLYETPVEIVDGF